ncbi:ComEC family competence protein [Maritimibacter sp. DP4N28-5]|uniref:ComEC family competence protein n=2 Tax=Maritimibacter dapengensis TaxID=2836868 RepID=A0ABS6T233_9RHOB|nr:ComEC/Rec2 family competence protein [Maritimibacter dapengensis]MBV7379299.1 ComEC family competence protein [Maritimibacter dapengensis]
MMSERLERLRGRLLLFAPVGLGAGIGAYFSLRSEPGVPGWTFVALLALIAGLVARVLDRGRFPGFAIVFMGLATILLGMMLAGFRAHNVASPVLGFRYYGPIEGRVVTIDRSQSDAMRLTLDHVRLDRVDRDEIPGRVRISLHGRQGYVDPVLGMRIAVTGHLSAPEGPVEPGGFDFRRMSWFRGIGAVGYARIPALVVAPPDRDVPVGRLRRAISTAVQDAMSGEAGAFAAAITTGDRSAMSRETLEALRASNLAHLLAISGLHMGLLVGFVFSTLRVALAVTPGLGQAVDVRRIAAFVALIAGAFYLALSGGAVSTSRAFVMVAVMMGAIMTGRRALTLRAVAIAALILLILKPETLVEAGFQMSFAATTALVAVFGALRDFQGARLPRWARPVFAVFLSSLVAGLATAPFAAAIFNRVAHYGLIANVLAVPVMGTLVMPLAVLAALLSPLGLGWVALALMRWPIEWILGVARWVAALDGSVGHVIAPQAFVFPVIALGGLAMVLLRGGGRVLGGLALLIALAAWTQAGRPDVLIAPSGGLVGVIGPQGRALSKPQGDGFAAQNWLENDGDGGVQEAAAARAGYAGYKGALRYEPGAFSMIHLSGRGMLDRLQDACENAGLVVIGTKSVEGLMTDDAPCLVIDSDVVRSTGAVAIYLDPDGPRFVTAEARAGRRLWTGRKAPIPNLVYPISNGRNVSSAPERNVDLSTAQ